MFHFTPGTSAQYPNVPFTLPPALVLPISGLEVDGLVMLWNGSAIVEMSNVDRVALQ